MEVKDVLGLEPVSEAAKIAVEKSCNGLGVFLEAVFLPGLQELGFLIKDHVRQWRLNNALRVMDKARDKICFEDGELQIKANARVGLSIIENCSMVDDPELQDMWAGLFASSCTEDGKDDSNIIFVDLIKRMSVVEARILKYACENCRKKIYPNGLITGDELSISYDKLISITGINDLYRLDRELDHMSSLSLFQRDVFGSSGGFTASDKSLNADISPSALALNLYYKCNSVNMSEIEFWKDSLDVIYEEKQESNE